MSPAATALTEITKEALALVLRHEREALLGRAWNLLRRIDVGCTETLSGIG